MTVVPLRERNRANTRAHLIECAGRLFGQKGFTETSVEDILQASGASRTTLYAHFEGKDALLSAIVEEMWSGGLEYWQAFGSLMDWTPTGLRGWLRRFADAYRTDAARNRAAYAASTRAMLEESRARHAEMGNAALGDGSLWRHLSPQAAIHRSVLLVRIVETCFDEFFDPTDGTEPTSEAVDGMLDMLSDTIRDFLRAQDHDPDD
ncbi:TetR/AcrR family transcriptional regulator [Microbacterium sp. AGC85]